MAARQHRSGGGLEHVTLGRGEAIRPQDEHTPVRAVLFGRPARLTRSNQSLQQDLQVLDIRWRSIVQDHEIDGQLLHAPVLVGAEELPDDAHILRIIDLYQDDRDVP